MENKLTKYNLKLIILLIIALFLTVTLIVQICNFGDITNVSNEPEYETIKKDKNPDYSGIGQEKVKNEEGYFTTFTTIDNYKKTYKEYKQYLSWWKDKIYWDRPMSKTGCGITALSIILSGYNIEYTPGELWEIYNPLMNYEKLPDELHNRYNIENSGFYYDNIDFTNEKIIKHLETNRPILVCVNTIQGKNRWTKVSHYLILLATDGKYMVYVSNPNGEKNTYNSSGWYNINEITPHIFKILYIESY